MDVGQVPVGVCVQTHRRYGGGQASEAETLDGAVI